MKDFNSQDYLRAMSGFIILILCLATLWKTQVPDFFNYVILALVAFLTGGALLSNNNKPD
jgi:hypothetical protein